LSREEEEEEEEENGRHLRWFVRAKDTAPNAPNVKGDTCVGSCGLQLRTKCTKSDRVYWSTREAHALVRAGQRNRTKCTKYTGECSTTPSVNSGPAKRPYERKEKMRTESWFVCSFSVLKFVLGDHFHSHDIFDLEQKKILSSRVGFETGSHPHKFHVLTTLPRVSAPRPVDHE
jgi:hypothetical protein